MAPMAPRVGNTKRPSGAKTWDFVWNNYPQDWKEELAPKFSIYAEEWVYQQETGESGTPHIQGYVKFAKKIRPIEKLKLPKEISWRVCRNRLALIKYCSDPEKRDPDGVMIKSPGLKIPRSLMKVTYDMLYEWQKKIVDKFDEPAPMFDRKVYWFWEPQGNIGKSIVAKYLVDQRGALVVGGKAADAFLALSKWIEKEGEAPEIVVFDVPRCVLDYVSFQAMEKIKDGLLFSGKYESGMIRFNTPHIICFGNEEPDRSKLSEDRWSVQRVWGGSAPPPNPPSEGGFENE